MAEKYGVSIGQAEEMIQRMVETGRDVGLSPRFDIARSGNTFDAHRLLHLARRVGAQDALEERLLAAVFINGEAIADGETLVKCAADVGLDVAEAQRVLSTDAYADDVRSDEREAARLGISSVPFFAFDRRYGVGGAQDPDVFVKILRRTWPDLAEIEPQPT